MFEVVVVNQYTNKLENMTRTANGKDWRARFLIKPLAIPLTNQHLDKYLYYLVWLSKYWILLRLA